MVKRRGYRNLTKIIFVLSLIWIAIAISWFFQTKDYSEVFVHCAIGIGAIIFSMIYEMVVRIKMDLKEMDDTVSSLSNWSQKEIEDIKKEIKNAKFVGEKLEEEKDEN